MSHARLFTLRSSSSRASLPEGAVLQRPTVDEKQTGICVLPTYKLCRTGPCACVCKSRGERASHMIAYALQAPPLCASASGCRPTSRQGVYTVRIHSKQRTVIGCSSRGAVTVLSTPRSQCSALCAGQYMLRSAQQVLLNMLLWRSTNRRAMGLCCVSSEVLSWCR
jgi:hypothetical protein